MTGLLVALRHAEDAAATAIAASRDAPDDVAAAQEAEAAREEAVRLRDICDRQGLTPEGAW